MYRPIGKGRRLHQPDASDVKSVVPNRRGTLFASMTGTSMTIWNVRPSCMLCSASRTTGSIRTYGENVKVEWSHDGHSLVILTAASYLLTYDLLPLSASQHPSRPQPYQRSSNLTAASSLSPSHGHRRNPLSLSQHQVVYAYPATRDFPPGAGEGEAVGGWRLDARGVGKVSEGVEVASFIIQHKHLILSLHSPNPTTNPSSPSPSSPPPTSAIQLLRIPYPIPDPFLQPITSSTSVPRAGEIVSGKINNLWIGLDEDVEECIGAGIEKRGLGVLGWWAGSGGDRGKIAQVVDFHALGLFGLITSTGAAYAVQTRSSHKGSPDLLSPTRITFEADSSIEPEPLLGIRIYPSTKTSGSDQPAATALAFNHRFAICAIGRADGSMAFVSLPTFPQAPTDVRNFACPPEMARGGQGNCEVRSLAWTSDGCALAVAHASGTAVIDIHGCCLSSTSDAGKVPREPSPAVFWDHGNTELFAMASHLDETASRLRVIPFSKHVSTVQPDPTNLSSPMFLSDDKVEVFRLTEEPDDDILNPDARPWRSVKVPMVYIATNWPIRHSCISSDGKLLAVAGTNGLTHFSVASGRWKLFGDINQEAAFGVQGGMVWYHHVLIASTESAVGYEIRLYSRDLDLTDANCLHSQSVTHPILLMAIVENNLLVYSADNALTLYVVRPIKDGIRLDATSRISYKGVIPVPRRVRALSWIIPDAQRDFGDPADDLVLASVVMLIDSRLVILRPREYDMHVLVTNITTFWISARSDGCFKDCIWAHGERGILAWLPGSLQKRFTQGTAAAQRVEPDLSIACPDMSPIAIVLDRGLLVGLPGEGGTESQQQTQLLLPTLIKHVLVQSGLRAAVDFAAEYQDRAYFAYALEVLLHEEIERVFSEDMTEGGSLRKTIALIDHFDESLEVLAACARKMEMQRWPSLFEVAGQPGDLFEKCMTHVPPKIRTAAGYLLMLKTDEVEEAACRIIAAALKVGDYELVQDIVRFTRSMDNTGQMLRKICERAGLT